MQELKNMKIWLCWNLKKTWDGKWTKVPIAASGEATGTDEAHRDTWVMYEEAVRAAKQRNYSGVGFVIPAGYFMLDIDHKELNDPLVQKYLNRFSNTYAEKSVSGHGAHVLGKTGLDQIPTYVDKEGKRRLNRDYYQKNSKAGIELYIGGITNRFCTYSGNAINSVPLADCTEAVLTTLKQDMRREKRSETKTRQKAEKPNREPAAVREDPGVQEELKAEAFEIVASLRKQKNGAKFIKLYDKGDYSDYGSQSEADIALCNLIAFRAGNNPELIDYIFRGSKLYRDKWEREDYREMTIRKAIDNCEASESEKPDFIIFNKQSAPVLEPSLLADYIRRNVIYKIVQDSSTGGRMPYVYDQGVYRRCDKESFLSVIKKPVMDYNPCCVKMPRINEAYNQLMTDPVSVYQEDLNADESIINFRNGLLYVSPTELTLRPHTPEVLSTVQLPCNWPEEPAPTPVFDQYMKTLTGDNKKVEQLLLEVGGVVISNVKGWRMKKALFLFGPGDTGKSVFRTVLESILGKENHATVDLKDFEARFATGRMYGKRLIGCSDISFARVTEMKIFKTVTGGDSIFGEFKGEQGFTFIFNGFVIFGMNRLPMFGGDDGNHVYERIIPVRCKNVIPKENQDKMLISKLLSETEGICCKFVKALQTVLANGLIFTEPECVIAEREAYVKENNSVIAFFTECMVHKADINLASRRIITVIYGVYREYCRLNGIEHIKTMNDFKKRIAEYIGITVSEMMGRNEDGSCFNHYDLNDQAVRELDLFLRSA